LAAPGLGSARVADFSDIRRRTVASYDRAIKEGRDEHERVLWHDPARQYYRFQEIVSFLPDLERTQLSVLDVGCGNGEFLKFLNFHGFRGSYAGIDVHDGMIAEASRRFPDVSFRCMDPLEVVVEAADIVVMSGIFNVDCGQTTDYVFSVLSALFATTRDRLVFNAISTLVNRRDSEHFYLDPSDAIAMAGRLSHRFEIRHGFVPYNFTMCIHRDTEWESVAW
jgi:SAM-dependent methyltransferase